LSRLSASPVRRRGKVGGTLDAAQDALLQSRGQFAGQVRAILGDVLAATFQFAHGAAELAAALAQLALEAHARFAHLTLEPVARGRGRAGSARRSFARGAFGALPRAAG